MAGVKSEIGETGRTAMREDVSECCARRYLAYYVVEAGAAEDVDGAGYWSGVITAAFMAGRVLSAYPLGRAADRFGRKPVLVFGLVSTAVLGVVFGMGKSVGEAIAENQIGERSRWGGAQAVAGGRTGDQPTLAKACEAARARVDRGSRQ